MSGKNASLFVLHKKDPQELLKAYAGKTKRLFAKGKKAIPVVIPSRNEEKDIVSCLIALARSTVRVHPIVVTNCSKDRTAERAEMMGATVVNIDGVKKMGATQLGIHTALTENEWPDQKRKVILFTDADTLVPRHWAARLSERLGAAFVKNPSKGAAIFGNSVYIHGTSFLADMGQCLHAFTLDFWQWMRQRKPLIRGHNYGLVLDSNGEIISVMDNLDPMQMYRDDVTIHDNLKNAGVQILRSLSPKATVITRGDRARSLKELLKNLYEPGYEKSTYDKQYDISQCPPGIILKKTSHR